MNADNFVLRTVYIDPDLDDALTAEAKTTSTPKAALFRNYLNTGYKKAHTIKDSEILLSDNILVLRTVYLDSAFDDTLRTEAFDMHVPKNNLIRYYLRSGMNV